jgi:DNA adenine methylase
VILKSPYPYFGAKSRCAQETWSRFGMVKNYVEPFYGSGAVLLANPHPDTIETVNDIDNGIVNFWRCLREKPEETASWADQPVLETELYTRHEWLKKQTGDVLRLKLEADPDWCDPKIGGWWAWGLVNWIGGGWCVKTTRQIPRISSNSGFQQIIHRGRISDYFLELSQRMKRVRVMCGDWKRVVRPSVTEYIGLTAIFLDPPYSIEDMTPCALYKSDAKDISKEVYTWAIENGENEQLRLAFCGYNDEYTFPDSWAAYYWKAAGGYGAKTNGQGKLNSCRETIWFSPHCIKEATFCLK